MRRFTVVGAGSWGTTVATLLRDRGHDVTLVCRDAAQTTEITRTARNTRYTGDTDLAGLRAVVLHDASFADADVVVLAVPSAVFADVAAGLPGRSPLVSLTKGLDPATGARLSTTVAGRRIAVLSGPNVADEIQRGLPAAAVVASADTELALELQQALTSQRFRVYTSPDVAGVELCGAAKNVIALAAGGADGLGLGDNAKAALVTRGLAEMRRLADAAGASPETYAGLAGMGDLIVTCWSPTGRNRRAGELIARGATVAEAREEIGQVVEGLTTAPVLLRLASRIGVELPIVAGVCAVLDGVPLTELLSQLMRRTPTTE